MASQRETERHLEILTAIAKGDPLTQRALAARLGVAVGLANLYLKRLARKGYIKIAAFPGKPAARKRLRYLLTPKGVAEKTRLSWDHVTYSLGLYRRTRQTLREALHGPHTRGLKRIALYGTGEAAELAYLTLKEFGLEPVAVYATEDEGNFLGAAAAPLAALDPDTIDGLVVATFDRPEPHLATLARYGVPTAKCLTLRRPGAVVVGE